MFLRKEEEKKSLLSVEVIKSHLEFFFVWKKLSKDRWQEKSWNVKDMILLFNGKFPHNFHELLNSVNGDIITTNNQLCEKMFLCIQNFLWEIELDLKTPRDSKLEVWIAVTFQIYSSWAEKSGLPSSILGTPWIFHNKLFIFNKNENWFKNSI